MLLRKRHIAPALLMRIGWTALILANGSFWLLRRTPAFGGSALHGFVSGVLFGVAIGCLLLGARLDRLRRDGVREVPCASR
jgi:hypothetical protein